MNILRTRGFGAATLGGMALGGLLATTLLCGMTGRALADAGDGDTLDLSEFERVTDDSLGVLRGGFRVGNVDLNFGVSMSTSVNGQQLLQTVFTPGEGTDSESPAGLSVAQGANGFQVTSPDGKTVVSHEIGQSITTSIANTGNDRLIQNSTTVNLFISNLPQVQAQAASAHALSTMIGDMNSHIVMGN